MRFTIYFFTLFFVAAFAAPVPHAPKTVEDAKIVKGSVVTTGDHKVGCYSQLRSYVQYSFKRILRLLLFLIILIKMETSELPQLLSVQSHLVPLAVCLVNGFILSSITRLAVDLFDLRKSMYIKAIQDYMRLVFQMYLTLKWRH